MSNCYCTITDAFYVDRILALYRSIRRHNQTSHFSVYCVDDLAAAILHQVGEPDLQVVAPSDYETDDIAALRLTRKTNEYCWTLKPIVLRDSWRRHPDAAWHAYLDGDMMAFADPDMGFEGLDDSSVLLTPHRPSLPYFQAFMAQVGRFNAGYFACRSDAPGRGALDWWEAQCRASCPGYIDGSVYADQKYLDQIPERFEGVAISGHVGLNAAPWNIMGQSVAASDAGGVELSHGQPLILYHMQGMRQVSCTLFDAYTGPVVIPKPVLDLIYRPYGTLWQAARRDVAWARAKLGLEPPPVAAMTMRQMARQGVQLVRRQSNLIRIRP